MACPESAAFISQPFVWGCSSLAADSAKRRARARYKSPAQRKYLAAKWVENKKTSLLLTQSSHSGRLYLTNRELHPPAWNGCARGDGERDCPMPGNPLLHPNGFRHWLRNAELCPSSPVFGKHGSLLMAVRGKNLQCFLLILKKESSRQVNTTLRTY